jgi:hypothetical protein
MNQRTRYFLIGSAFVVLIGLCTGIVAYYGGDLVAGRAATPEFSYLPPDTTGVAYVDVQEVMKSGFAQKLRQFLPTGEDKDRLAAELGVDLERDIDSVVASMSGGGPQSGIVVLRGRFDAAKIEAAAVQHGGSVSEYHGKKLLVNAHVDPAQGAVAGSDAGLATAGAAFLDKDLLALGQVAALHRAIDTGVSNQDITDNPELMKFVNEARQSGNVWAVGRLDSVMPAEAMPDQLRAQLPKIQWFAVTADVDQALTGSIRAQATDVAAGDELRKVVNGALAAAKLFTGSNPAMTSTLNSMQVTGQGADVRLSFTLTAETFEQMHVGPPATGRGGLAPGPGRGPEKMPLPLPK